jgi:hypothetical protein
MPERKAEDRLAEADEERRAARKGRDDDGRPVGQDETAPGEQGDAPYGDSEKRPSTPPPARPEKSR